ncbi:craniofacial development protein 1 isoform X1 [Hydra vulgaris]|uniref:craniofacial development protein 1 isoform X1 n=1 Tax=Hydra vulgaris TaxID=6087 RepID=UPI000640E209|nr:craniofacial development protein 1 isoform X1 [Hydra vulgaris]
MALVFDSDEDGGVNELVGNDEDDEVDDDDYVPEKKAAVSDDADDGEESDPDFNLKKKKVSSKKRGRPSKGSPPEKKLKSDTSSKKGKGRPKKSLSKESVQKSPVQKGKPQSISKDNHNILSEETEKCKEAVDSKRNSLRRSSRSTRAFVSYADADLSGEEEHLSDYEELDNKQIKDKKLKVDAGIDKKKHAENLWSDFKEDVNKKSGLLTKNSLTNDTSKNVSDEIKKDIPKHSISTADTKTDSKLDEKLPYNLQESNVKNLEEPTLNSDSDISIKKSESAECPEKTINSNNEINHDSEKKILETIITAKEESPKPQKPASIMAEGSKKMIAVTETYDFAGETVKVTKQVLENDELSQSSSSSFNSSLSNSSSSSSLSSNDSKRGGVANVLDSLKKKKMSVLDKSKHDWESYKAETDLTDELKKNKGVGFLDKQDFLNRVDYQQWEREREMRLYTNRK